MNEFDPNGKQPNEPGAKLDANKNRLGLVLGGFSHSLEQVGLVGTYGADKYIDNGWVTVPNGVERYTDALYRHLLKDAQGELVDQESGLEHLAHACWNLLAIIELKRDQNAKN